MITVEGNIKNVTGAMWRLVHNDAKVITLIEGKEDTITSTIHNVEEFDTEQEALDRITELGLEYEPEPEE